VTGITPPGRREGYKRLTDTVGWSNNMMRRDYEELQRKLLRARRLAKEPGDSLSRERAAQAIEDLEYQLFAGRLTAQAVAAGY
jgi:hypothetical protein